MLGIVTCEHHHFKPFSVGVLEDLKARSRGQNIPYNTVKV